MGEVYRARDTKLNRDVAIKVLLSAVADDPDRLARFGREAQVLASLNHPNIAHIHGLEESNGVTALVMELVEGEELSQRIARGPIPLDEALPIARQIAEALEAAHECGIIHRDLKPANIKVRPDGTVKVLDFGLAKAVDPTAGSSTTAMNSPTLSIHATQAGIILGTAAYMSPEQARGKSVDKRTDIWALGCVLFEMLTGSRAFPGDDATDTIVAVVSRDPDWKALPSIVPATLRRLLRKTLEKDPRRRLDSAAAVRIDIDDATVNTLGSVEHSTQRSSGWRPIVPWAAAATLAVALVAALWSPRPPSVARVVRLAVTPPVEYTRRAGQAFALSPDGQTIAFIALGRDGVSRMFVRRLDRAEAQLIAGTENTDSPFWSPDGASIGFFKAGTLYRMDLDGRVTRRLCDVPGRPAPYASFLSATWSGGVIVFPTVDQGIFQVADAGGTPTPVTALNSAEGEASHSAPSFLPDGRRLLFLVLSGDTRGTIWVASLDNPARTRLVESSGGAVHANGMLFTTSQVPRVLLAQPFDPQTLVLSGNPETVQDRLVGVSSAGQPGFAVSTSGTIVGDLPSNVLRQLTWMDRSGKALGTIGPVSNVIEFAARPDRSSVVSVVVDPDSRKGDLWLHDGSDPRGTRLTFESVAARRPMWSRDGRRIYYTVAPRFELRSLVVGTNTAVPFDNPGGFVHFEDVTSDGRSFLLKSTYPATQLWLQSADAPEKRRQLAESKYSVTQGRISPDGRWLAYTERLPDRTEVFVQPLDRPDQRVQLSRAGGFGPLWRTDGRELFYEGKDGLMAVPVTDGGTVPVIGKAQLLFALRTQGYVINQPHNIEVAADGTFLVNTIIGNSDSTPLEVTVNWTAGPKK